MTELQRAAPPRLADPAITWYTPIAGTHGWRDAWQQDTSPFGCMMRAAKCYALRAADGRPFRWTTFLNGLVPYIRERDWEAGTDALSYFLQSVPYANRNIIAHSHGGQLPIRLAAQGFPLRTLTTIATPVRHDVDAAGAAKHITYWQHLYDSKSDLIGMSHREGLAGQIGDGAFDTDRFFKVAGMVNIGLPSIKHSRLLEEPGYFHLWHDQHLIDAIRTAGGTETP